MKRTKPTLSQAEQNEHLRRMALFRVMASNTLTSRASYGSTTSFDGLRDVYDALGYPQLDKINFSDYYLRYRRQDLAGKIVEKPVDASWRRLPIVSAAGDDNDVFKNAWEDLEKELGIHNTLIRADKTARIGKYGILLMGFQDNTDKLNEPLDKASKLLYLQPYTEDNAPVKRLVTDKNDPRYGLPEIYSLKTTSYSETQSFVETEVHYSRIIHIAENLLESNIYALPPLERVYNRLLNMELLVGGSAEMFWQGAFPGLAFTAAEDASMDSLDAAALEEEIQKYVHKMERYMKLQGLDVKNLAPAVADPSNHVDVQLKMIAIATGIPKRILEGSERGELSSTQDTEAWDDLMDGRRKTFVEANILRPVVQKNIDVGVLPEPLEGFIVEWPDLSTPSDKDRAEVGRIRSEGISKYLSSPDAQLAMPFEQFLLEIMELPEEKVNRIIVAMEENLANMLKDDGQGDDDLIEEELDIDE